MGSIPGLGKCHRPQRKLALEPQLLQACVLQLLKPTPGPHAQQQAWQLQ